MSFIIERLWNREGLIGQLLNQAQWLRNRQAIKEGRLTTVTQARLPSETQSFRKPALFGADGSEGFALDWAADPRRNFQGGPVPRAIIHNTEGIHEDSMPLLPPQKSEIQESRRLNYESVPDQEPTSHRGGRTTNWDGQVRVDEKPHGFESSKPKESTIADQIAKELKNEPYWFGA
jgi:hypothetical protein